MRRVFQWFVFLVLLVPCGIGAFVEAWRGHLLLAIGLWLLASVQCAVMFSLFMRRLPRISHVNCAHVPEAYLDCKPVLEAQRVAKLGGNAHQRRVARRRLLHAIGSESLRRDEVLGVSTTPLGARGPFG